MIKHSVKRYDLLMGSSIDRLANFTEKIKLLRNKAAEDLRIFSGVDLEKARSFVDFFSDQNILRRIEKLLTSGVHSSVDKEVSAHPFFGKKFYVNGEGFKVLNRNKVADLVRKRGGDLSSFIERDTDFILFGEPMHETLNRTIYCTENNPLLGLNYTLIKETRFLSTAYFSSDPENRQQIEHLISLLASRLNKRC